MKNILTPVFLAGLLVTVSTLPLSAETLDEAIGYAVRHHPSVKAAAAGREAAFETVNEYRSGYYPDVSVNAAAGRIYADNTTTRGMTVTRGAGYSWFGEGAATVRQTIYDWSQTSNRVNAAKSRHLSADASVQERQDAISYQVSQAYIQILRTQALLDKAEANFKSTQDYKKRIESLVKDGGADESELSRARDIVSLAENARLQHETDYQVALASYIEAVGRPPEGNLAEPFFDMGRIPADIDSAMDFAMINNPQIRAANYETEAAAFDIETEKANILPRVNAEMSYMKRDQDDVIGGEAVDGRALVRMTWDYSVGGAQLAAQRRSVDLREEAKLNKAALERVIMRDVRVAWASLNMAQRQKENEAKRLKSAKDTLANYREQYEGSKKTVLDLMHTDMQVFNADTSYLNVYYRELDSAFALAATLGLLEEVVTRAVPQPVRDATSDEVYQSELGLGESFPLELRGDAGEKSVMVPPVPHHKPDQGDKG